MKTALACVICAGAASAAPSVDLTLHEIRIEGAVAHMRLVAEPAQGALTFDAVSDRFDAYCAQTAQALVARGQTPDEIVVSIADRAIPFGETAPDVTQFFELYDLVDGQCVWRAF